ncbi:hypothetical protein [uncultured Varibaculum sp.]|uniref:hypothetical protein n=1 Tax=uncultured Varibaculum sp. TaxID=413896 RepID=UPI0027D94EC1|nr:hypothetical protein [uncultured Varibaculum sp.]
MTPPVSNSAPNRFPSSPAVESVGKTWKQDWLAHLLFSLVLTLAALALFLIPFGTSVHANNVIAVPNDFDSRLNDYFVSQGLRVEAHSEWSLLKQIRSGANYVITNETMANAAKKSEPDASFIPLYPYSIVLTAKTAKVSAIQNLHDLTRNPDKIYLDQSVGRLDIMSALALTFNPQIPGSQTFSAPQAKQLLQEIRQQGRLLTGSSLPELRKALDNGYFCLTTDARSIQAASDSSGLYYGSFPTVTFQEGVWQRHSFDRNQNQQLAPPPAELFSYVNYPSLSPSFLQQINARPVSNLAEFERFTWNQSLSNDSYQGSWEWKNTNESYEVGAFICLLCLLSFWAGWRFWTTVSPYVRWAVLIQAALLSFWILARIIKHSLPGVYERYAWYYYYVPIYGTMMILFFVISHSTRSLPPAYRSLRTLVIAMGTGLMLLVFTNDFHHLLLRFGKGESGVDYQYGPVYYLYYLAVLLVFAIIVYVTIWSFKGNRIRPLLALGALFSFILLYSIAYTIRIPLVRASETVQIYCIYFLLAWEILFFIGVIPQNRGYTRFFNKAKLPIEIVDHDWNPRFSTAIPLSLNSSIKNRLKTINKPLLLTDTSGTFPRTLYCQTRPINSGHVIWETDVTAVNELEKMLAAIREQEAHQTKLLSSEYEALLQMEESSYAPQLYDRLDLLMDSALDRVQKNTAHLSCHLDKGELAQLLRSIKLDLGYAKRAGMLTLSQFQSEELAVNVLTTLLSQSCTDFSYANTLAGLSGPTTGTIRSEVALHCLEGLHRILDCLLSLSEVAIFINLAVSNQGYQAHMNCIFDIPTAQLQVLQPLLSWSGAKSKLIIEDGQVNLQMSFLATDSSGETDGAEADSNPLPSLDSAPQSSFNPVNSLSQDAGEDASGGHRQ